MQVEHAKKEAQALGRSSGGFCTKLHLLLGNQERLLGIELSGGQESDHKYASALVFQAIEHKSRAIVGGKDYDSLALHKMIGEAGMKCVVPYRKWMGIQRPKIVQIKKCHRAIYRQNKRKQAGCYKVRQKGQPL